MPDQCLVLMIQILRNMKLLQTSRIFFPVVGRLPLLRMCSTSDTLHFSFSVLAQLFGGSELPTSRCCRGRMLQDILPCNLQKWQAWLSGRMVPKYSAGSRRGWFQRGQLACASNRTTGGSSRIDRQQGVLQACRSLTGRWL